MPKMILPPRLTMALGGYIRETIIPYGEGEGEAFPYRNVIVGNPSDEPVKIEVPVYDRGWIERHRKLGLIVVPVNVEDDFVGLFNMVREKVRRSKG
ncbi:MAG TPA: hypothetical protein EYH55_01805 [Methanothermococcus okinawensis]|uniref:Energy-converting hydrogenase B, subunit P n=1 Tax=Methanothermococcus okinawensis TaxID=155863 RepID=A0A832ZXX6_9EURY|nr:hypothetical protein [Methanothermococcus okinawensis]